VVLDEPQQRVGDDGVEVVLRVLVEGDEADPQVVVTEFRRHQAPGCLGGHHHVLVGEGRADPDAVG
jgi:hypothetical protein